MKKRILAVVLSIMMVVAFMPTMVFAGSSNPAYWTYTVTNDGSTVKATHGSGASIELAYLKISAGNGVKSYDGEAYEKVVLKETNWAATNIFYDEDDITYYDIANKKNLGKQAPADPGKYRASYYVPDANQTIYADFTIAEAGKNVVTLHGSYDDHDFIIALNDNGNPVSYRTKTVNDGASFAKTYRDYNADSKKAWYEEQNPGYKFMGWYVDEDCSIKYNFNDEVTTNLDLYAKFVAKNCVVSFDTNGGNTLDTVDVAYNDKLSAEDIAVPTKNNYVFVGWADRYGNEYDFNSKVKGNMTLYAVWEEKADWIVTLHGSYDDHDFIIALNDNSDPVSYRAKGVNDGASFANTYRDYNADAEKAWYEEQNPGYKFMGWYTDEDCTARYNFNDEVTANLDLYAKFVAETCVVSFDTNGGNNISSIDVAYNDKLDEYSVPEAVKENYVFKGWVDEDGNPYDFNNKVTENITLTATWSQADWTVTLHGSYESHDFIIALNDSNEPVSYRAKAMKNGEAFAETYRDYNANAEKAWYEEQNPGYKFMGWYTDEACTDKYNFNDAVYSNINLYAKFAKLEYTIKYNAGNKLSSEKMVDTEMTFDDKELLSENKFTRKGYQFVGWSTVADPLDNAEPMIADYETAKYSVKMIADLSDTDSVTYGTEKITLYAIWTPIQYKLTYVANSGDINMYSNTSQVMYYDDSTKEAATAYRAGLYQNKLNPVKYEKTGYQFTGWNTKADGTGVDYTDKQVLGAEFLLGYEVENTNLSSTNGDKVKLYAQWKALDYPVIFYANNGTSQTVEQAMTYDKAATLKANSFSKAGYYFKGWSTSENGPVVFKDEQSVKNIATGDYCVLAGTTHNETKGVKLYAQWTCKNQVLLAQGLASSKRVTLSWANVTGATHYDVYGAKCGSKFTLLGSTSDSSFVVTKIGKKKLVNKKNYKFVVYAYDKSDNLIATSNNIHSIVNHKNGKTGNITSISNDAELYTANPGAVAGVMNPSISLVKGATKTLSTGHDHKYRYLTSDSTVATVSADGTITAVAPGTCYVYVQALNGVWTTSKVVVNGTYTMVPDNNEPV